MRPAYSDDRALTDAYRSGDVYHTLAMICGLTHDYDRKRWKTENPAMRQRMKSLQLAINYGISVPSLAKGLDRHPLIAATIIERHSKPPSPFWEWRNNMVKIGHVGAPQHATLFGWPLRIFSTSPNRRTLYNFPMQANRH